MRSIDLRHSPRTPDGATWAVFAFFFLALAIGIAFCAALLAARLRRTRDAVAPAPDGTVTRPNDVGRGDESLRHAV